MVKMRLRKVAELAAELWIKEPHFENRKAFIRGVIEEAKNDEEIIELCDFLFCGPYISSKNLRLKLSEEVNVYPHTISQSLGHETLPEILASESEGAQSTGITITQCLGIAKDLYNNDILTLCNQMDELEALLFWSTVLTSRPISMSQGSFLYALAWAHVPHMKFKPNDIHAAYSTIPFLEVVIRLLKSPETLPMLTPRPDCAMKGGHYQQWGKTTMPENSFVDIVRGPRRFLYIHNRKATLRNSDGAKVIGLKTMWDGHKPRGDWIVEVESMNNKLWCVTDCLYYNESKIHLPYKERIHILRFWASNGKRMKVIEPMELTGNESATQIMSLLDDNEIARIVENEPYKPGDNNGWILVHHAFQFRLLITQMRKNEDGFICLRLAVLDGFDSFPIHTLTLDAEASANVILILNRRAVSPEEDWEDIENLGIVVEGTCTNIEPETYKFLNFEFTGINGELGRGDTSQFTDIVEACS